MAEEPEGTRPDVRPDGRAAARARIEQQQTWVDLQVRKAIDRGDFDDLPGAGKPIRIEDGNDPNWWVKKLIERENVTILPPSLALRREDAELDEALDRLQTEAEVRTRLEDFNERVIAARYRLPEGPPLITMPRDVEATVTDWAERRAVRREQARAAAEARAADEATRPKRRWFGRRR